MSQHVSTLIKRLSPKSKIYIIPDFQRGRVWNGNQIVQLIDSLYKGYPVGQILVWENPDNPSQYYVIDGLQRLSTLAALHAGDLSLFGDSLADKTVYFDYRNGSFKLLKRTTKSRGKNKNLVSVHDVWRFSHNIQEILEGEQDYIASIMSGVKPNNYSMLNLIDLVQGKRGEDFIESDKKNILRLSAVYSETLINEASVSRDTPLTHVIEIFNRLNSSGTKVRLIDSLSVPLLSLIMEAPRERWRAMKEEVFEEYFEKDSRWRDVLEEATAFELIFNMFETYHPEYCKALETIVSESKKQNDDDREESDDDYDTEKAKNKTAQSFEKMKNSSDVQDAILDCMRRVAYGYATTVESLNGLGIDSHTYVSSPQSILRVLITYQGQEHHRITEGYAKQRKLSQHDLKSDLIKSFYLLSTLTDRYVASKAQSQRNSDCKALMSNPKDSQAVLLQMIKEMSVNWKLQPQDLDSVTIKGRGRVHQMFLLLGLVEKNNGAFKGTRDNSDTLVLRNSERHHIFPISRVEEIAKTIKSGSLEDNIKKVHATLSHISNITCVDADANSYYSDSYPSEYLLPEGSKYIGHKAASNFIEKRFLSDHKGEITLSTEFDTISLILNRRQREIVDAINDFVESKLLS